MDPGLKHAASWCAALFYEPLVALAEIHRQGHMHRDVSQANLLVVSREPPELVLCDMGKMTQKKHASSANLGPLPSIAPEVDLSNKFKLYDSKIDICSYGYGILQTICCGPGSEALFSHDAITLPRLTRIHRILDEWYEEANAEEKLLVELLRRMMQFSSTDRISAKEALRHPFFELRAKHLVPASTNDDLELDDENFDDGEFENDGFEGDQFDEEELEDQSLPGSSCSSRSYRQHTLEDLLGFPEKRAKGESTDPSSLDTPLARSTPQPIPNLRCRFLAEKYPDTVTPSSTATVAPWPAPAERPLSLPLRYFFSQLAAICLMIEG